MLAVLAFLLQIAANGGQALPNTDAISGQALPDPDTVPVVKLSPADTTRVIASRDRLVHAEAEWQLFKQAMLQKYKYQGAHRFSQDYRLLIGTDAPISYIELAQSETEKARSVHQSLTDAKNAWNDVLGHVAKTYLSVSSPSASQPDTLINNIRVRSDLGNFTFTKDFRFIVPR